MSPGDRLTFWLVNLSVYLRHPVNIARFRRKVGYFPNVALPTRYNEKMLWRKIFDRNPLFITFSDKLATKEFQARHCPALSILPALWTGADASKIPAALLGKPVVVKASHGHACCFFNEPVSGDPESLSVDRIPVATINGWLSKAYGQGKLEWAYRFADKQLFVEELIGGSRDDSPLIDISVHASDGRCLVIEAIVHNKTRSQRKGYFRADGRRWPEIEKMPVTSADNPPLPDAFQLPPTYVEAIEHTRRLSAGIDYARFDFLARADRLYGGEITVYPGSGLTRHDQFINYNNYITENWDLSKSWFLSAAKSPRSSAYADALRRALSKLPGEKAPPP